MHIKMHLLNSSKKIISNISNNLCDLFLFDEETSDVYQIARKIPENSLDEYLKISFLNPSLTIVSNMEGEVDVKRLSDHLNESKLSNLVYLDMTLEAIKLLHIYTGPKGTIVNRESFSIDPVIDKDFLSECNRDILNAKSYQSAYLGSLYPIYLKFTSNVLAKKIVFGKVDGVVLSPNVYKLFDIDKVMVFLSQIFNTSTVIKVEVDKFGLIWNSFIGNESDLLSKLNTEMRVGYIINAFSNAKYGEINEVNILDGKMDQKVYGITGRILKYMFDEDGSVSISKGKTYELLDKKVFVNFGMSSKKFKDFPNVLDFTYFSELERT